MLGLVIWCTISAPDNSMGKKRNEFLIDINASNAIYPLASNDNGIYYGIENNILYYDYRTEQTTYLCSNVNCEHSSDICNSFVPNDIKRIFINSETNKLFYTYMEDYSTLSTKIIMCEMDGSNKKVLYESKSNEEIQNNIIISEENIYVMVNEYDLDSTHRKLLCINNTSGKVKEVYSTNDSLILITAFDNNIIFLLEKSGDIYSSSSISFDYEILTYNVDSSELSFISSYTACKNNQEHFAFVKNNYLYDFYKTEPSLAEIYKTDLKSGKRELIVEEIPFFGLINQANIDNFYDGKFNIYMRQGYPYQEDFRSESYIVDINSGDVTQNTLSYYNFLIPDQSSVSDFKDRFSYMEEKYGYVPVEIIEETTTDFIINTSDTSVAILKSDGKDIIYELDTIVATFEIVAKEDYYNNIINYKRFR